MHINHLLPSFVCFFLSSQASQGLDVTTLASLEWQHLTGCYPSFFSAATVSCFSPLGCLSGFPVTLLSDSRNKKRCTRTGRVSAAQGRTRPTVLTYRLVVAAGRWELDSAAGCNLGQQIQLLSPPENNKQLLLKTVRWHRRQREWGCCIRKLIEPLRTLIC